jgi:hypothetical protein
MLITRDLTRFGGPSTMQLRGCSVKESLNKGDKLLFLFGERHTIKPYISRNILNAIALHDANALSCIGVEGEIVDNASWPHWDDMKAAYSHVNTRNLEILEQIVDGLLLWRHLTVFSFSTIVRLLRQLVPVESVDDPALRAQASGYTLQNEARLSEVQYFLRSSPLFEPTSHNRECLAMCKADVQWSEEFAEMEVNHKRDSVFVDKMMNLWARSGMEKPAILNAGFSHQYRIATLLPPDVSYIVIEQP